MNSEFAFFYSYFFLVLQIADGKKTDRSGAVATSCSLH